MQELENKIKKLEKELEEVKAKLELKKAKEKYNPNWRPDFYEDYFCLATDGVDKITFNKHDFDYIAFTNNFVFPTKEQAQKYLEWYQAFVELVRLIAEVNVMYGPSVYDYSFKVTTDGKIDSWNSTVVLPMLRIKSKIGAQKLIKNHSDLIRKVWTSPW